jgi:hypothetical protein
MDTVEKILGKYDKLNYSGEMPIQLSIDRENFSELFCELNLKIGAEIGVEQGAFSESLCQNNPHVKHFAIDPWKAYHGYRDHVNQEKLNRFFEATKERLLSKYDCIIMREFSLDIVKTFKDESLDYIYIDANHTFQNFTNDLCEWSKKVRVGGIISGHDYHKEGTQVNNHVFQVINAYTDAYFIKPWFVTSERSKSFFWVKQ